MAWGESNLVKSDSGMKILYRGILNSFGAVAAAGLTQDNRSTAQQLANTTLSASTPRGILSGSVVAVTAAGTIGKATTAATGIVGLAINDAAGYAYESASGAGSGKLPYLCGAGSLVAVNYYETAKDSDQSVLDYSTSAGLPVYASANGLLVIAAGINAGVTGATVVGVIVEPPTASNPFMVVQLRV